MATPRIFCSGQGGAVDLNDGVHLSIGHTAAYAGLMEPAQLALGGSSAGHGRLSYAKPRATHYLRRSFTLETLYVERGDGLDDLQRRAHDIIEKISGRPSLIQGGTLTHRVALGPAKYKQRFESPSKLEFSLSGESADDGLWDCLYGHAVGTSQGIPTRDDRLDNTSLIFTDVSGNGRVWSITNPGSAPCRLALMVSGVTSGTTYYLKNVDQRTTDIPSFTPAGTAHYLPPEAEVIAWPGTNVYRLQSDGTGTLVSSGTFKWAVVPYVTQWKYLGNDGNKFNESPVVVTVYRRGAASYNSAANTHASVGDLAARIGLPTESWATYTDAKAGLVIEGATTNLCTSNQATGTDTSAATTGFANVDTGPTLLTAGATIASDTAQYYQGSRSLKVTCSGGATNEGFCTDAISASANTVYTITMRVRPISTGGGGQAFVRDYTNGVQTLQAISSLAANAWGIVTMSITTGASPVTNLRIGMRETTTGVGVHWWVDAIQIEAKPFATSWVDGTRNADYAAVHLPQNYLKYSRDLTQTSAWTVAGTGSAQPTRSGTTADGTASGNLWVIGNTDNTIIQSVTPDVRPSGSAWCAMVALRLPSASALSGSILLQIEDQDGNLLGTATTIATTDLSTTATRTFFAAIRHDATGLSSDTGLRVKLKGNSGTGNVEIEAVGLVRGLFPGPIVQTRGSNIPRPQQGWQFPFFIRQNGYVEWKAVLPPISTGFTYLLIGDADTSYLALARMTGSTTGQNYLRLDRRTNGGLITVSDIDVGNVWDGGLHTFRIEWLNYTRSGTQYMLLRLYVDGALKTSDTNRVTASITSWAAADDSPHDTLWVSDGSVFSALRNLTIGVPAWTAGDIPSTAW